MPSTHFAAQLPEMLRGIYYEGWDPSQVPVHHDVDTFVRRFASEAQVRPTEVRHVASTVTAALQQRLSGGQLITALEQLPERLRELLWAAPRISDERPTEQADIHWKDRLVRLEQELQTLTNAVNELIHGLEHTPLEEPTNDHTAKAAHRAHQILLTGQPHPG